METTPRGTQPPYQDCLFYPQPGDIVLSHKPTIYTDGTPGPLIQIYKDNFHFEYDRNARTTFRKPHTQTPDFKRGDKILRLFKIYRTWEFVLTDTHRLHIYYPGFANNWHWFTANTAASKDHLKAVKHHRKSNFRHFRPSKIFTTLSQNAFQPNEGDIIIRGMDFNTIDWMEVKCLWCKEEEERNASKVRDPTPPPECLYCYQAKKEGEEEVISSLALPENAIQALREQLTAGYVDQEKVKCVWCKQEEESRQNDEFLPREWSAPGDGCAYCNDVRFQVQEAFKRVKSKKAMKCLFCQKEEDEKKKEAKRETDLYWKGEDMDLERVKCMYCMKEEGDESEGRARRRSQLVGKDCVHEDEEDPEDPEPVAEGCVNCTAERMELKETLSSMNPWRAQYEIKYWTEKLEIRKDDLLVRYAMDTKYDQGTFKKTHLQAELFSYTDDKDKQWKYLGMDVANFGPMPLFKDIVYRPQPGDIIISRNRQWGVVWRSSTNVGGFAMFYKDPNYFGENCMGQNLFPPNLKPPQPNSETSKTEVVKPPTASPRVAPETHTDSWLIRVGEFDEYWDFRVNDRAEIFLMHPNGKTMSKHYTADYQHLAREPDYQFDEKGHKIKEVMEVQPNQWDLIVRRYEKTKESTLRNVEWERDPDFWMKDPMLWGKDIPPRYDKDVEIHTYWSGFVFQDKDLLVRPAFVLGDGVLPGPEMYIPNYSESEDRSGTPYGPQNAPRLPISTYATVEVYQVSVVGSEPPVFMLCGRDKFEFPTQRGYREPNFEYAEGDGNLWDTPNEKPKKAGKEERKGSKVGEAEGEDDEEDWEDGEDGENGENGEGGSEGGPEGEMKDAGPYEVIGNGTVVYSTLDEPEPVKYDVWAEIEKEKERRAEKKAKNLALLRLAGGDKAALP